VQALRAFAYGVGSVLIGVSLARSHLSGTAVGVVFACILLGSAIASVALGRYGDEVGRRTAYRVLLVVMGIAGTAFALTESLPLLVLAALTGTVSTDVVESGPFTSLEQAMSRHPRVFDRLFRAMVRSGEQSGRLEDALDRIAFQVEKTDALRRQVKSALMYPAVVFTFAVVVLVAIVCFVIPVFVGIFREMAAEHPGESAALPAPTQLCVSVSEALTGYWFVIIPAIVIGSFVFFRWKKTERGRDVWERFILRLPFQIGDVIQKVALARWSRTFAGSVSAGVPMLQSIKLTGQTAGNIVIEKSMADVYESVKRGGSLAGPIEGNAILPPMVGHMVAVGEETGQLETMLGKIADFYEAEVDAKVKALTALLEPLMIVFVGGMVGFIVISMYLPMFSIYEKIR